MRRIILLMIMTGLFLTPLSPVYAATFTVNSNNDGADANIGNGVCATASGACTLRAAIQEANFSVATDTINFSIGSGLKGISLNSSLPTIINPIVINGTSQPGFSGKPLIRVRGRLRISAGNSTVSGLIVNSILLSDGNGNTIRGNYIGTNAAGDVSGSTDYAEGVLISNSDNNMIGGTSASARNVISGKVFDGVKIHNDSDNNQICNNYIGINADGTAAVPNGSSGVLIWGGGNSGNVIGGASPACRNIISGNKLYGVEIQSADGNTISNNYIGLNPAGNAAISNQRTGISTIDVSSLTIAYNVISGNLWYGIELFGESANVIQGNYIGVNAALTTRLSNRIDGITLQSTSFNVIRDNVIGGNGDGIQIESGGSNTIISNYIGVTPGGIDVGNFFHGIYIRSVSAGGNSIGIEGSTFLPNIIANNGRDGIRVFTVDNNAIRRNAIYANGGLGINLTSSDSSTVTLNDAGDTDAGGNHAQNFPVITSITTSDGNMTINGKLNSHANATYTLDFFASEDCDPSGYGEGQVFIGELAGVTTNSNGVASFAATFPNPVHQIITVTATSTINNTSEFSKCRGGSILAESQLANGSFETGPAVEPANWNAKNLTTDNRICSSHKSTFHGTCAFQFTGGGLTAQLMQTRVFTLASDDTLTLSAYVQGNNVPTSGAAYINMRITYSNGNFINRRANFPSGTYPYRKIETSATLTAALEKVRVAVVYAKTSGKVQVDAVGLWMNLPTRSLAAPAHWIPLPPAP